MSYAEYEIEHVRGILHHPVVDLLGRGVVELSQYGTHGIPLHWEQDALYIEDRSADDRPIIAALSYRMIPDRSGTCFICMAYVDPAHRRKGMYSALYRALLAFSTHEDWRRIEGIVHNANRGMMEAAEEQGRVAVATTWVMDL